MTFGSENKKRSDYGVVTGPYEPYLGMYVRIFFNGGQYTAVGKIVHADGEKVLLLPCVVNMSTKKTPNLVIKKEKGNENLLPVLPLSPLEVLAENDEVDMCHLEELIEDYNNYKEEKKE